MRRIAIGVHDDNWSLHNIDANRIGLCILNCLRNIPRLTRMDLSSLSTESWLAQPDPFTLLIPSIGHGPTRLNEAAYPAARDTTLRIRQHRSSVGVATPSSAAIVSV